MNRQLKKEYRINMTKMNLVNKLYQKSVIDKLRSTNWKRDKFPFVVELDPTTVCDLHALLYKWRFIKSKKS